ncbi:MAG TPA: TrkA C-terminal domain-containing protein, partial [Streptosporangiaceae bacterium]|nr:TrkA C-terminal domain-containing protein [Streptosporangiaceae bacterium]
LAVAIATATSRALSYGTIYTTKLLRRGYDVDRAAPWRAFADLKAADVMRPFPARLAIAGGQDGHVSRTRRGDDGVAAPPVPLPGTVTYRSDPQAVYAGESLRQTLRQLAAYGRDGLPVLSGDGGQAAGWITNDSVLDAIAREIGTAPPQAGAPAAQAADARHQDQATEPPNPLPGYQVLEITIGPRSPGAGKAIGTITWPRGYLPVSVLHGSSLHEPDPDLVLAPGDRISLLTGQVPGNGTNPVGRASHRPRPG